MSALVVLVIVAAVTVVVVQVARQAGAGRRAVEHHHRALDTLSHITGHTRGPTTDVRVPADVVHPHVAVHPHVRVLPDAAASPPSTLTTAPLAPLVPAPPERPGDVVEAIAAPRVSPPQGQIQTGLARPVAAQGSGPPRRRPALRRRRTAAQTVLAAAVLVVGAIVALFAGLGGSHPHPGRALRSPGPTTPPLSVAVPAVQAPAVSLVSADAQTASYEVQGTASIKLVGAARCWVEIREGAASGQVVYQGVLGPGQIETATGPAWLRIGDPPAVSVTVNGTPLTPPAIAKGQPYDFVVQ